MPIQGTSHDPWAHNPALVSFCQKTNLKNTKLSKRLLPSAISFTNINNFFQFKNIFFLKIRSSKIDYVMRNFKDPVRSSTSSEKWSPEAKIKFFKRFFEKEKLGQSSSRCKSARRYPRVHENTLKKKKKIEMNMDQNM